MRGLLRKTETGIAAELVDAWGYKFELTGVPAPGGYAVEVKLVHIPDSLQLPGDVPEQPLVLTPIGKRIPAPKPGKTTKLGEYCPDCGVQHDGEACSHDMGKPCAGCGEPVGMLTKRMDGTRCWKCVRAAGGET